MLRAFFYCVLSAPTQDPANAQVFVKYKSHEKAALIVNLVNFNDACAHKARRLRLPTLGGLAHSLAMFVLIRRFVNWMLRIVMGQSIYPRALSIVSGWRLSQTAMQP